MGINNDNNISTFEEKTTLIENSPLAKNQAKNLSIAIAKKIQGTINK